MLAAAIGGAALARGRWLKQPAERVALFPDDGSSVSIPGGSLDAERLLVLARGVLGVER